MRKITAEMARKTRFFGKKTSKFPKKRLDKCYQMTYIIYREIK